MGDSGITGIGMTSARTRDRLIERLRGAGIDDERVLERMRTVPRHVFVDEALSSYAYEDKALPLGYGQTISQPYIVALMTSALVTGKVKLDKVLEIGTGCGYQTAVLASFARHVYSIERIRPLRTRAQENLRRLKIHNVSLRHSDGWRGWRSQAPFDGILVTAAPVQVPQELLDQLADGGTLVIPTGSRGKQTLLRITRQGGRLREREIAPVSFVPLIEGTKL